jgi:hypothetical protein
VILHGERREREGEVVLAASALVSTAPVAVERREVMHKNPPMGFSPREWKRDSAWLKNAREKGK